MLGPGMILTGTPLAAIYAAQCWCRGMRSHQSLVALVIALLEASVLACAMVVAALR